MTTKMGVRAGMVAMAWLGGVGCSKTMQPAPPTQTTAPQVAAVPTAWEPPVLTNDDIKAREHDCERGNIDACYNAGIIHVQIDSAEDAVKATAYFDKACQGGHAFACFHLGNAYWDGNGVATDMAKAAAVYDKACQGSNMNGCFALGVLYYKGTGVAKDTTKAAALFEQACQGGYADGCAARDELRKQ